jgi:hypothetical protein
MLICLGVFRDMDSIEVVPHFSNIIIFCLVVHMYTNIVSSNLLNLSKKVTLAVTLWCNPGSDQ